MKKNHVKLGLLLIGLSVVLHGVHYAMFHDLHHIMIFLVADIAFIPLEVFFVSLVLEKLIEKQEEEKIIKKMNMLVGLFYQQLGHQLLKTFVKADKEVDSLCLDCHMDFKWQKKDYEDLAHKLGKCSNHLDMNKINLEEVHQLIKKYEQTIVTLISNPILLEKEMFSDVLMSVFHLYEELASRELATLSDHDKEHLMIDCQRVYTNLSCEWLFYMEHLQSSYPYLFYTAVTENPYDKRDKEAIEKQLISSRVK